MRTIFLAGFLWLLSQAQVLAASPVEGSWSGNLGTAGVSLKVVLHIASQNDGSLTATMDSPDQMSYGNKVDTLNFTNGELRFEIKSIQVSFEGKLDERERMIVGFWTQFGQPQGLNLTPYVAVARKRPQEPQKPYPYVEENVTFENKAAQMKYAGTFTKPSTGKKHPTVVLISGSGPQDRNEEIMEHKPFLVLADYLTRRGVAVLRVDDRGVGGTTAGKQIPTVENFDSDVLAAVDFLKSRSDVDKRRLGLIGHSEGGLIAPLVATRSKDIAFIVLLAGPGVKGMDVLKKQNAAMQAAMGVPAAAIEINSRLQQSLLEIAAKSDDVESAQSSFDAYWKERTTTGPLAVLPDATKDALGKQLRSQLGALVSPRLKFFLNYEPAPTLSKVRCPVLALNGSLDVQVVASQNLPAIEAALKAGGNKNYVVKELPGLNHLFQTAKKGTPAEYVEIEETMSPVALDLIGEWIVEHTR